MRFDDISWLRGPKSSSVNMAPWLSLGPKHIFLSSQLRFIQIVSVQVSIPVSYAGYESTVAFLMVGAIISSA